MHTVQPASKQPGRYKARPGMRLVGLCRVCKAFVELNERGCDSLGHGYQEMAAIMEIPEDKPLYRLPSFNWGAFLMPPIWGAGHGQVFAIAVYPMWLMVDNLLWAALHGEGSPVLAGISLAGTLAFMAVYARMANYTGYLRVAGKKSPEEYVAGERVWTLAMGALAVAFAVLATWYNLTMRV